MSLISFWIIFAAMNFYLDKYGFQPPTILSEPDQNLGIIIVIPCFNEPDIITTLNSLDICSAPETKIEVVIVINSGTHHEAKIKTQNTSTLQSIENWKKEGTKYDYHIIMASELPKKHAGVGLARKIGMDEAVARFHKINHDGIIVCFDADSQCSPNYLSEIEIHFKKHKKTPGCAIKYAHPIEGNSFDQEIYTGIINYELFLRYYNQALRFSNLPFSYHTVGSSMAVRASAYQKQGGMNKRKAGEDFYFLHKIIALGNFTELNSTQVIPSPRTSDRVPFGTGKAINDWIQSNESEYLTYDFRIWVILKDFVTIIPLLQKQNLEELNFNQQDINQHLIQFLIQNNFQSGLNEIRKNATNESSFLKRFFVWFNAFRVLKLVHFLRDVQFPNQPILNEAIDMAKAQNFFEKATNEKELLIEYRLKEEMLFSN